MSKIKKKTIRVNVMHAPSLLTCQQKIAEIRHLRFAEVAVMAKITVQFSKIFRIHKENAIECCCSLHLEEIYGSFYQLFGNFFRTLLSV